MIYFDTSALVKLLVREPGSGWALELWLTSDRRVVSLLAYVETVAALAAAKRSARLSADLHRQLRRDFESLWERVDIALPTKRVVRAAAELAERHALRGYDSVHLASALQFRENASVMMLTWDNALGDAAVAAGIPRIRPTTL